MARPVVLGILGGLGFMVLYGARLVRLLGPRDLPMFWAYLGVWAATMVVAVFVVDPGLIQERIRPGPGGQDYVSVHVLSVLWLAQVVAVLDVGRYHWSDTVPLAVQVTGVLAMAAAMAVLVWAEAVNLSSRP